MTLDRLREIEALCASLYFTRYTKLVRVLFATREQSKVPTHWTSGVTRKSQLTNHGSPRKAADPLNALLNYSYALAESTIKQSCLIVGLDPALGVMHTDKAHRDSMTLDILEPLRPTIDRHIKRLTDLRRFQRSDFLETPQGQCKLTETTTHYLAEAIPAWNAAIAPTIEWVSHELAESSPRTVKRRTPLTQRTRLDSRTVNSGRAFTIEQDDLPTDDTEQTWKPKRGVKPPTAPAPTATCRECGNPLLSNRGRLCSTCWNLTRQTLATERAALGRNVRRTIREQTGTDPAQTQTARTKRSESLRAQRAARDTWDREHVGELFDRAAFTREIVPLLASVPLGAIVNATGVSVSAASRFRNGSRIPHPRHWGPLITLTDVSAWVS